MFVAAGRKIVVVCPTNELANTLVERYAKAVEADDAKNLVVRVYQYQTELEFAQAVADPAAQEPPNFWPVDHNDPALTFTLMVRERYLAHAARPHSVFDRRMTNPARSVAHYIVTQLLGLEELVRRDFGKPITLEGSA